MTNNIVSYNNYQNDDIETVETTRATFMVGQTELLCYNYQNEVYLNLSQAANIVNKNAISLFDFLKSNTFKAALGNNFNIWKSSYYTTDELQTRGKKPRIVKLEYVTLFWADQASKDNLTALKLLALQTALKVKQDAELALNIGQLPPAKAPTMADVAKAYLELAAEKEQQLSFLLDKPGLAAKLELAHQPKALDTWMSFNELCALSQVVIDDHGTKCKMSARVAQAYQNDTHTALPKVTTRYKDKNGKQQAALKTQYNVSCVSYLQSAMASK